MSTSANKEIAPQDIKIYGGGLKVETEEYEGATIKIVLPLILTWPVAKFH